jgi:hypothetical protein
MVLQHLLQHSSEQNLLGKKTGCELAIWNEKFNINQLIKMK